MKLTIKQHKGLDVITIFHSPAVPASFKALNLLKRASAVAGETATEDQVSDHTSQTKSSLQTQFELNITEDPPTPDQLKSILEYVGAQRAGTIIEGAKNEQDAMSKWKGNNDIFQRPLVSFTEPDLLATGHELTIFRRSTGIMEKWWRVPMSRRS